MVVLEQFPKKIIELNQLLDVSNSMGVIMLNFVLFFNL